MSGIHDFGRNGITPWDTRFRPLPVPTEGIFDEPTASICINVKWLAHLDGLLSRLLWLDAWQGDRVTQLRGVGEVVKLMASLIERNPCGDEMTLRPSPDDCKILQIFEGGEWVTFWDLNECVVDGTDGIDGQDGASPEMRVSGGYIQWRQDDDSPTWTNLIAVADLIGSQGDQGPVGLTGQTGQPGSGGNIYPPMPTSAQPDALCNAATYIVQQVRGLIADVYVQLDTIEPGDVFNSLLGQNGWSFESLYSLVAFQAGSLANEMTNLAAYDAAAPDLVCELISLELDKSAFVDWIETAYAGDTALRDLLKFSLNAAAAEGKYALWAAYGATLTTANCDDCETPAGMCDTGTLKDFRVSMTPWAMLNSRGTWIEGSGIQRASGQQNYISVQKSYSNQAVSNVKVRTTHADMGTLNVYKGTSQTYELKGTTTTSVLQGDGSYIWDVDLTGFTASGALGMAIRFEKTTGLTASQFLLEICHD